ncbi:MAG TPA: hypothetical protein EYG57_15305, partial [Planctomycetes bacterium]|nr:hypothetical protein [Planctomycetota bacterium]
MVLGGLSGRQLLCIVTACTTGLMLSWRCRIVVSLRVGRRLTGRRLTGRRLTGRRLTGRRLTG